LRDIRRNHESQGWKFDGTVDENNLKIFCREENMVFDDFLKIEVSFELMHKYPLVLDSRDVG
jgi:hypothetical protein